MVLYLRMQNHFLFVDFGIQAELRNHLKAL